MGFELKPNKGAIKRRKRVGRGDGSGHGKTCCRGENGQKSRSGKPHPYVGFEGGQMPLQRRLPKRGFNNIFALDFIPINVSLLNIFDNNSIVDIKSLKEKGLINNCDMYVKILGEGDLSKNLTIKVQKISKSALEKVNKAGGKFEEVKIVKFLSEKHKKEQKETK